MENVESLCQESNKRHSHLCPRQVLGVRIGLAGLAALGFSEAPTGKRVLAIVESDGCFADGVSAATGCTVGHRTLRVEDYGKVAATLAHVETGQAVRVAPVLDSRQKAAAWLPCEPRRYIAQLLSYQAMPDEMLLSVTEVQLTIPVAEIISRPGLRVMCDLCGEEIINAREIIAGDRTLCRACAGPAYYLSAVSLPSPVLHALS